MTDCITIDLPFPPKELMPNKRIHWRKKNDKAQKYKSDCHYLAKQHRNAWENIFGKSNEGISVSLTFFQPDRRRRDDDNMEAAFKPGRDGIAEAFGIDDYYFSVTRRVAREVVKHGMVRVKFEKLCNGL